MSRTAPRWPALLLVVAVAAAACSPRTAGSGGGTTLTATFAHVRNLAVGHAVRIADVQVGTVTAIELGDDLRPTVTMELQPGTRVPAGTSAALELTSLLGENYVGLRPPDGYDPDTTRMLDDGARITETTVRPETEEVVDEAIDVVAGVAAEDVATVVDALEAGLDGRGGTVNRLIGRVAAVADTLAGQRRELGTVVDQLGRLGRDLAAGRGQVVDLIDNLEAASGSLARQRGRTITTLRRLTRLARTLRTDLIGPHGERLTRIVRRLVPIARTLAASRAQLDGLVDGLLLVRGITDAIVDDQARVYARLVPPGPAGTATTPDAAPSAAARSADPAPGGGR